MPGLDILILYEHVARELDVVCLLKHLLERDHGLTVGIAQHPFGIPAALAGPKPRIVVLPYCYSELDYMDYFLLDWRRSTFVNLAWEQLLYAGNKKTKNTRGAFATRHVIHQAWGDFFAEFLRRHGVLHENIFINGNPTYWLYEAPYKSYFKNREALAREYTLNLRSRWIFFPENYNWAFYPEEYLQMLINRGNNPEEVRVMRDFCRDSLAAVLRWCEAAARSLDAQIILRPRPATPLDTFRERVASILTSIPDRLFLIKNETIREWILASDIVVSSYSTSLIEAAVAQKPAYMLEPFQIPESLFVEWHTLIPHLKTDTDFQHAMSGPFDPSSSKNLRNWATASMMSRGDAIQNMTELLSNICKEKVQAPDYPPRDAVLTLPGNWPTWMRFEKRRVKNRGKRLTPLADSTLTHEDDLVSAAEIEKRVGRWQTILSKP